MNDHWRPKATVAISCLAAVPILAAASYALDGTAVGTAIGVDVALIVFLALIVLGIGCGIAGVISGSNASRKASRICLYLWTFLFIGSCLFLKWFSQGRWG